MRYYVIYIHVFQLLECQAVVHIVYEYDDVSSSQILINIRSVMSLTWEIPDLQFHSYFFIQVESLRAELCTYRELFPYLKSLSDKSLLDRRLAHPFAGRYYNYL